MKNHLRISWKKFYWKKNFDVRQCGAIKYSGCLFSVFQGKVIERQWRLKVKIVEGDGLVVWGLLITKLSDLVKNESKITVKKIAEKMFIKYIRWEKIRKVTGKNFLI